MIIRARFTFLPLWKLITKSGIEGDRIAAIQAFALDPMVNDLEKSLNEAVLKIAQNNFIKTTTQIETENLTPPWKEKSYEKK